MSLTVLQKIDIGRVCSILASDELNSGTIQGGALDKGLPIQLYACTEGLEMLYDLDSVNADLEIIGNDLISKCRHYARAVSLIQSGGTNPDISTPTIIVSPIPITGADFASALSWTGTNHNGINVLAAYGIQVFWNSLSRFLQEGYEFTRTATGFDIIVNGVTITAFNSQVENLTDQFYIFISP